MKHLVLLGGGAAHVHLMHELARQPLPGTQITWVAPHSRHIQTKRLAAWVAGRCELEQIAIPLRPLAEAARATWTEADVVALDAVQRSITLNNGQVLSYDCLSVDVEAGIDREAISGAREYALLARPIEHFVRLWSALLALAESEVLSLVVVGGDAAGAELALAAQQRLGKRARVAWVTGNGPLLPSWPEPLKMRVRNLLKRGQVTLFEDRCMAITGNQMQLGLGMRLACDAPVWVPPLEVPAWLAQSGLGCDAQGDVLTTPTGQSASHAEVFVGGERLAEGAVRLPVATRALNLRRWLAGGPLLQARAVPARQVLHCSDGSALLQWGPFILHGRVAEWFASRGARRAVARYRRDGFAAASPNTEAAALKGDEMP